LKSKPTWRNAFGCSATSAFLFVVAKDVRNPRTEEFYLLTHGGNTMTLLATFADVHWNDLKVVTEPHSEPDQRDRIIEALGPVGGHLPSVDEETLSRYYEFLTARLSFPFTAYYPEPATGPERSQYHCTVLELLDPTNDICDEFDGILCKTHKGKYEINLPLTELEVADDGPNFQFIEDYWYWFWNWR
jgi:hypothetical protein